MKLGKLYFITGISTKGAVTHMKMKLIGITDTYYKFLVRDSIGFIPLTFKLACLEEAIEA